MDDAIDGRARAGNGIATVASPAHSPAMTKSASAVTLGIAVPERGFTIERKSFPGGVTETAGVAAHTISLHVGAPVRVNCTRNGRNYVGLTKRGDMEIVPKGEGGRWIDDGPAEILIMRIEQGFLNKVASGLGLDPATLEILPRVQARDPQLEHLGWVLEAALAEGRAVEPLFLQGIGIAIATRLIKEHATVRQAKVRRALSKRQTAAVCDHIDANLTERLTLANMAGVVGVSASHFKSLFKAAVGVPAHRYVMRRRVARAVDLIKTGKTPLAQVALETGFAHQSHLARAMRAVLGRTPSELAREYR